MSSWSYVKTSKVSIRDSKTHGIAGDQARFGTVVTRATLLTKQMEDNEVHEDPKQIPLTNCSIRLHKQTTRHWKFLCSRDQCSEPDIE